MRERVKAAVPKALRFGVGFALASPLVGRRPLLVSALGCFAVGFLVALALELLTDRRSE